MEAETILGVFAQLAVFIVGLSGIVAVVGSRATGVWQIADHSRMWSMMASGFALLFQAIFPFILHYFLLTLEGVWVWSSASAALIVCGQQSWRWVLYKRVRADPEFKVLIWRFHSTLLIAAAIIFILNALGLVFKGTFAPYLLAMFLQLAHSCASFIRLLFVALPRISSTK